MTRSTCLTLLMLLLSARTSAQQVVMAWDTCRLPSGLLHQREEGDIGTVDFSVNAVSFLKSRFPAWRGQGITICLKENAPDPADIDLRGRLLPSPLAASVVTPHATQMATILAGIGNFSPFSEGVAPRATLIPASFASLLPESDAFYRTNHITIVNHSYGTDIEPFYGAEAVAYDAVTSRLPTLLHVFSAGNLGYASSPSGRYANLPTVATLTGNFKESKNTLTVGSIGADGAVSASSSRGPAYDGRLKPELVAYSDEGSSGAAALTSGISALLQQALRQQTGRDPSAALLKAILINSADDAGSVGIDYQSGYGSVNAFAAAQTITSTRYNEGSLTAGEHFEIPVQVSGAQRLKITLTWTDPPAGLNSPKALINDLDLTVSNGRTTWQPWVLNPFPNLDSLRKPPVRMRDTLNNAEQITLDAPTPGTYTIRVSGTRIDTGQQAFALAWQWETPGQFYWTTPNAAPPVISDTTLTLRWKNTTPARYGTLDFSPDAGQTWQRVRDSVVLDTERLVWKTPDLFTTGLLRMRIADSGYVSAPFRLSPVPTPTVLFACADSLGIAWTTKTAGRPISLHNLYRLTAQDTTWTNAGVLTGNETVLKNGKPGDLWAIAPVTATGEAGIRSEPIDAQSVSCYYQSLTATPTDSIVLISCELSAPEALSAITFQKQTAQGLVELSTQPVTAQNSFYGLRDSLLQDGPNLYRVRLLLKSGAVVYSDFVTAYVIRKNPFLLYPNPVERSDVLTIRAAAYGPFVLRITDEAGRVLHEYDVADTEAALSLAGLSAGLYPYVILRDAKVIQAGKLLVR